MSSTDPQSPPFATSSQNEVVRSGGGSTINSTIAIVVLCCIGSFLLAALIKFYDVCRRAFMEQQEARERAAASWAGHSSPSRKGLTQEEIRALPVKRYGKEFAQRQQSMRDEEIPEGQAEGQAAEDHDVECVVCLCEFEEADDVKVLPSCNHMFHVACIDQWLNHNHTCPLCRVSLLPEGYRPRYRMVYRRSWWDVAEWMASGGGIWRSRFHRPRERYIMTVGAAVPAGTQVTETQGESEIGQPLLFGNLRSWLLRNPRSSGAIHADVEGQLGSTAGGSNVVVRYVAGPAQQFISVVPIGAPITGPIVHSPRSPAAAHPLNASPYSGRPHPEYEASSNGDVSIHIPAELLFREGNNSLRDSDLSAILEHARSLSMATRDGGVVSDWDSAGNLSRSSSQSQRQASFSVEHHSAQPQRASSAASTRIPIAVGAVDGNSFAEQPMQTALKDSDELHVAASGSSSGREQPPEADVARKAESEVPEIDVNKAEWVNIDLTDEAEGEQTQIGQTTIDIPTRTQPPRSPILSPVKPPGQPVNQEQAAEAGFFTTLIAKNWLPATGFRSMEMSATVPAVTAA